VSAAGFGALTAACYLLREHSQRLLLAGIFLYLIGQFTFERLDVSVAHVLAALVGLAIAHRFWRRHIVREINTDEFFLTRPLIALWRILRKERAS
jgi:uncharacterized membrane protein